MVALGAFAATSIAGVVLGGVQGFIFEDTGWIRTTIGLSAGAGVGTSGVVAPFVGRLVDRYGARKLMPVGTLVVGICLIPMIWVGSIWQFFLIAIVARAIGQPLLIGVVPRALAVNFFRRRRNFALALTGTFLPISGAITIQIFSLAAVAYGWRTTFSFLGIFSLILTIPMVLLIRRSPEDIGLLPDGESVPNQETPLDPKEGSPAGRPAGERRNLTTSGGPEESWAAGEVLRTRTFWLIAVATFLGIFGGTGIAFNMVPYLHETANLPTVQAVGVLSLSTSLAFTALGWGYLADKISPRKIMVAGIFVCMGLIIFLFTVRSIYTAYLFGALWGITQSGMGVLVTILLARYYGRGSFGTINGVMRPFEASGLAMGQIMGGLIYDLTGTYQGLFIGSFSFFLLSMVLILMAGQPVRSREGALSKS